jgi:hypothetical protein
VTARIDHRQVADLVDISPVCVPDHDQIGTLLTRQQRERRPVVFVPVDDQNPSTKCFNSGHRGEARTDACVVAVSVDGQERSRDRFETVQHRRSREIARVDDLLGSLERLPEVVGQVGIPLPVGVRQGDDHATGLATAR